MYCSCSVLALRYKTGSTFSTSLNQILLFCRTVSAFFFIFYIIFDYPWLLFVAISTLTFILPYFPHHPVLVFRFLSLFFVFFPYCRHVLCPIYMHILILSLFYLPFPLLFYQPEHYTPPPLRILTPSLSEDFSLTRRGWVIPTAEFKDDNIVVKIMSFPGNLSVFSGQCQQFKQQRSSNKQDTSTKPCTTCKQ